MPRENILIVDDEPFICSALKRELQETGYNIDTVLSGEEALEAVKQKDYCLALIDVNMPRMNGLEACRRIKKINPGLMVIFITGEGTISDTEIAAAGGRTYLFKPFVNGEVQAQIKKAMSERAS